MVVAHCAAELKLPEISLPTCRTNVSALSVRVSSNTGTEIWPLVAPAAIEMKPVEKVDDDPVPKSCGSAGSPVVPARTRQSTRKPPAGAAALRVTV